MSQALHDALVVPPLQRSTAPFRPTRFAPVEIDVETREDGTLIVRNRQALKPLPVRQLSDYLRKYAEERPNQVFLAEPAGEGWREITYGTARAQVDALSQWLIDRDLRDDRPVMVLSDNGINHALLQLAAMQIGMPAMPVSVAYSLMSSTCGKIADLVSRFQPSVIYASDPVRYGRALSVAKPLCKDAVLLADAPAPGLVDAVFKDALATRVTPAVDDWYARVGHDDTARLLLTSGSTGLPKAVTMTQRNILTSGVLWDQVWPFLADEPLRIVDWLPWNHTAGAHGAFSAVLRHGGTLYIDDGKPVPQLIDRTVQRLSQIRPNVMYNVPRGLDMLVSRIEEEPALAKDIFANLQVIVYGGAALSPATLHKLETLSAEATGFRVPVSASLGSTETTMPATLIWWPPQKLGTLGLPCPGVEAKLVPEGERYEIRFRGDNITPGYFRDPKANEATFDEEGFLRTGDAVSWATPGTPEHGLIYAGRLSENFKLATGTWVSVATVRTNMLEHLRPFVSDAVLCGPNQDELGALLFLNSSQIRKAFPELSEASDVQITSHPPLLAKIADGIRDYNQQYPASSTRIARALLLDSPPSIDDGEITDKGHINQRGVLALRSHCVQQLYGAASDGDNCLVFAA